jgi:alkylhydroperoxidase/carboxymuconolactone decarboxylase family protein YurZ
MPTDPTDEFLVRLADSSPELIERIVGRHLENIEESGLDPKTHALVRIASLVTVGAPLASFAWQVSMAREAGASDDEIGGVLVAVAPTAGLPRVVTAAPHVGEVLAD